jgi:hypothetical protein
MVNPITGSNNAESNLESSIFCRRRQQKEKIRDQIKSRKAIAMKGGRCLDLFGGGSGV